MKIFFDRTIERKVLEEAIQKINLKNNVMIWLEGESGVGKSYLLRHSLENIHCPIFQYLGYKNVYKCDKQDLNEEFLFVSNILATLQNKNQKVFQSKLYNYFSENNYIHILDAFESILPNIPGFKWSKDLLDKFNDKTQRTRDFIIDKTLKSTMILCFTEIILPLLEYHYKNQNILFCIDDIVWMDQASLETLETLLSKLRVETKYTISISFFVTSRNRTVLESNEQKNYDLIDSNFFHEFFTLRYSLMIRNFNQHIVREIITEGERLDLYKYIDSIYEITEGNPQELTQTLKFEDLEIIRRINDKTLQNEASKHSGNYFTRELIESLPRRNEYTIILVSLISLIEKYIKSQMLMSLCALCVRQIYKTVFDYVKYEEAIDLLKHKDLLVEDEFISIKHDSIKALVIDYLNESGDFEIIGNIIADFFLNDDTARDEYYISRVNQALSILKAVNPQKGLNAFIQLIKIDALHYSPDNIRIAASCFCVCFDKVDCILLNDIIVPKILQSLVSTAQYQLAKRMCELIYNEIDKLSQENKIIYLTCYIKVLIDLGIIKKSTTNKLCAIEVVEFLLNQSQNSTDLLLAYLLKMSAHEHILEFREIKKTYEKACEIVDANDNLSNLSLSTFYRNKGLVAFHPDLEQDYLKACDYARKITEPKKQYIMLGTCYNNLGLSYFYKGKIDKALEYFNESYNFLKYAGYDLLRVINNISVCHFMRGEYEYSYKQIAIAKSMPLKGIFESLSVDVNMALNMYKYGQLEEAKKRLDNIIKDYTSGNIKTDTAAYSAAMVNRGYIAFQENEYLDAYKLFKASKCHTYKNADILEQKKRKNLCDITLYKENVLSEFPEEYIDLSEKCNILFQRPYSLILLAFYVI